MSKRVIIAGFAVTATLLFFKETIGLLGKTTFDDAFMVTRYAKHWLAGDGFSWNTQDGPAFGVTSPLYLIIITAVMAITQFSDATVLTLTSYIFGLVSVGVLVLIGFTLQEGSTGRKSWTPLLVIPALLLSKQFEYHCLTGMETTLSLLVNALLAWSVAIAGKQRNRWTLFFCLFCGYLSWAVRPDNGLYALLLPPLFFVLTRPKKPKYALFYLAFFLLLLLVSLILAKVIFGDFLPLPFYAKKAGFYKGYLGLSKWNVIREMLGFWTVAAPFLLVIIGKVSRRSLSPLTIIASLVIATFSYFASVIQIMGYNSRYYYPTLAFVVFAAFTCARSQTLKRKLLQKHNLPSIRLACGLIVFVTAFSGEFRDRSSRFWERYLISKTDAVQSRTSYPAMGDRKLPSLGWWESITRMSKFLETVPPGTVLAASEYGFIGSHFPELTIIDLLGLHDRTIAHLGFDINYVLSRAPDLIWFPHQDYTGIVSQIQDNPGFQHDYVYYLGAYDYGLALLRKSERYDSLDKTLRREFSRIYKGLDIRFYLARGERSDLRTLPISNN